MNMKKFLKLALGTGLFILDQSESARRNLRERVGEQLDDLRDRAHDTYESASDRVQRASYALRGDDDNRGMWNALRFVAGVGIGVGVALLVAPASGEQTRSMLASKAQEFGGNVRHRFNAHDLRPTGTGD